mgnify:CR=1 FL=1
MQNKDAFFALLQAGLWEKDVELHDSEATDFSEVLRLAAEQSVVGLVAAGLERYDVKKKEVEGRNAIPQMVKLQLAGQTLQIEQRNKAMNAFVAELIEKLRDAGVYAIMVKGQGIAQCYERPLWRSSGDVDLLLSDSNYEKAKALLTPIASDVETEYTHFKHQGMTIDGWVVELHGTLHSRLSARVDRVVDEIQKEVFFQGKVRSAVFSNNQNETQNGIAKDPKVVQVFLPAPDEDVVFVITHILHHFFFEGIGLRQICDWCRLLYTYRESLDRKLLESRLCKAGLMTEWKAFAAFAVEYLGMPMEAMPLFNDNDNHNANLKRKADGICRFVLEVGNFGHNQRRDFSGMSYMKRKFVSFWGRMSDMLRHFRIFPLDSIRFFGGVLRSGLHAAVRGE